MGQYARGDSKKTTYSSEEDEGYDDHSYFASTSAPLTSIHQFNNRGAFFSGLFREIVSRTRYLRSPALIKDTLSKASIPKTTASDETDRQFWAEDESSGSDRSRRSIIRRRRRRSMSYRNRIAMHRHRRRVFHSPTSSSDSIRLKVLPSARNWQRYGRRSGLVLREESRMQDASRKRLSRIRNHIEEAETLDQEAEIEAARKRGRRDSRKLGGATSRSFRRRRGEGNSNNSISRKM
ncbi:hypothetical protein KM043_003245 [Ampulex compressa]|nr:hypothetical protein KM043_003245 [Ampulex compressa]